MKYRRKPIIVKATQTKVPKVVKTLEGDLKAQPGDWIVTGPAGEQWPVKKEVFSKTYEKVPDDI